VNERQAQRTGVLFLNAPTLPPLGADTWVHIQIVRRLDRARFAPVVACAVGTPERPTRCYAALRAVSDVEVVPIDLGPELSAGRSRLRTLVATLPALRSGARLVRLVRRRSIAFVHTSDRPRDAALAVVLGRLTRAHVVVHVHVGWGEWMNGLLKWSLRKADTLVAISEFVATTLVESGHDPARIRVVLNGIDTDRWVPGTGRDRIRDGLGIGPDAPVLLSVCRLFEGKGVRQLIEAMPALRDEYPDVRLLIVGGEMQPGFKAELESLVDRLGLGANVSFTGVRSDVDELMAACDVYVMPSQWEPFGLVFAEAMAMERPVVALDNGGTPEVVDHEVTGLLSPLGDHEALVTNLKTLLADPDRRREMGRRGRQVVLERFTLQRLADDVGDVYDQLKR
jgi:glycosyltransferase involved in cell wall biosynthesis